MKVKFDAENKYVRKNNNPSFQGFTPKKDNLGKRVYEFNYPYDSKKYDCYLEVCSVETDDYGNYYVVEGLENNLSDDKYLKLPPEGKKINLSDAFDLRDKEPFAYHYVLVPKGSDRSDPNVQPTYKIDAGDYIDSRTPQCGHEIYNIVTGANPITYNGGSMKLLMPDFYNPLWTYDNSGKIVKNNNYDNLLHISKTFSNKIGGNLAGIEKDVRDGKFDGYARIISTPLFTDDSLSSHAYWNKNCMQIAQSLGNINNYTSLQIEMFKKGINFVSDGAYVNEGLEGIHFKHVLKWGEKSPYFEWFKAHNLKNSPLALGVFGKNTEFARHKLVNAPFICKQNLKTGEIQFSENKNYDPKKPTYFQIYDTRLLSDVHKNDPQYFIKNYDILNTKNILDINTHEDTVIPYSFEINPETYKKNIEKLNEYNKLLKSSKDVDLYKTLNNAIGIVFPINSNPQKTKELSQKLMNALYQIEDNDKDDKLTYKDKVNLLVPTAKKDSNISITPDEENKLKDTLLKLRSMVPLDSYIGTRFVAKFENFALEEKIEGNFNTWDANTDIAKLNYLFTNADTEYIKLNYPPKDQVEIQNLLESKAYEVQDYAITSAKYWTEKTKDILNLYIAQQLKFNPLDEQNPKNVLNKVLKQIESGNLPEKLKSEIDINVIRNVLTNKYKLRDNKSNLEYKDYLLGNLMDLPLDTIEFADSLAAVLASPYITKRGISQETINKTRYDMFLEHNPHLADEYITTYTKMDNIYQKELLDFASEIIKNLNELMPEGSKIYNIYNTTEYGRYVIPQLANIITKHAFIKALAPNTTYKVNESTGEIIYDYNKLKEVGLESLNIHATSPKDEAAQVLNKLQSGIKKISKEDKKELTDILYKTLRGTNTNSFRLAEMITDRVNAGLDWRIDAAKDIGDMDAIRAGDEKIDNVWPAVTKFWRNFTDAVYSKNPNSYIVAEITDEGTLYDKGHGKESPKYTMPNELIKKFLRETNMTSTPNYSQFFSSVLNFFGKHFEKYDQNGTDFHNKNLKSIFKDKCAQLFEYMPYLGVLGSYNFIGNHDKPRVLQGLILDTQWYNVNLTNISEREYRRKAYRILNDKYLGDILDESQFKSHDEYLRQVNIKIDSQDLSFASGKALAMAEALQKAFDKSISTKYPHNTNPDLNEKVFGAIFKAITDLANGEYKGKNIQAEGFGVKPVDIAIDIIIDQAIYKHGLSISKDEQEELKKATLKIVLEPALKKLRGMTEVLNILPGAPTLYAGDDLGATGYESESKNIYLHNRSFIHNEWLNKDNKDFKYIQDHYDRMNGLMKMRGRPELHALNDGAPFLLDTQDGKINGEHVDITGILRQGTDNSIVISLINPTGLNHDFAGEYNPGYVTLERIDIQDNGNNSPKALTKGLTPGTKLYNAENENDTYVVRKFGDAVFIKRLIIQDNNEEKDGEIILNGTTLTLYSEPQNNKDKQEHKTLYNKQFHLAPINNRYNGDLKQINLGKNLSLISKA